MGFGEKAVNAAEPFAISEEGAVDRLELIVEWRSLAHRRMIELDMTAPRKIVIDPVRAGHESTLGIILVDRILDE